jgi:hypothetical protein
MVKKWSRQVSMSAHQFVATSYVDLNNSLFLIRMAVLNKPLDLVQYVITNLLPRFKFTRRPVTCMYVKQPKRSGLWGLGRVVITD